MEYRKLYSTAGLQRAARTTLCALLLGIVAGCDREPYEAHVDEPDPQLDPTETRHWEPLREGLSEPPEHRQPLDVGDDDTSDFDTRLERREQAGEPRTEEGPPATPTEQPLPVDAPIPRAVDDRPQGLDPTEDPVIETQEPQP